MSVFHIGFALVTGARYEVCSGPAVAAVGVTVRIGGITRLADTARVTTSYGGQGSAPWRANWSCGNGCRGRRLWLQAAAFTVQSISYPMSQGRVMSVGRAQTASSPEDWDRTFVTIMFLTPVCAERPAVVRS